MCNDLQILICVSFFIKFELNKIKKKNDNDEIEFKLDLLKKYSFTPY